MNYPQTSFSLKHLFSIIVLSIFLSPLYAQVGVGTTIPDPSSALDVTSSTQGFLAPRMTTAERTAIGSPAESLLVYDTDERAFYFYETTAATWVKINSSSEKRNNYKLVKSTADLAPELAAGGGTKYLLTSNTYYEINGMINLSAPIDINNAYVSGLDANEDILFSSGIVFQGGTGGSVRNVTITGGGTAFNISGPGISSSESLILQNTIIYGMANVGTISNIGLYFGNIVQFVGNTAGITYSNIGNLLLNNQAWGGSNNGTYETLTGSFGFVQKVSGFSTVNSPAVGFDVSANPTLGTGVLLSTVFTGTGTFVNGYDPQPYIGYNFTNVWTVDCPGIPAEGDSTASGYIYFATANATPSNVVSNNTPVKMAGVTSDSDLFRMSTDGGINNRLKYTGSKHRNFTVTCSATLLRTDNGSSNVYSILIYKNGSSLPSIVSEQTFENGISIGNFTVLGLLTLDNGDYIEVFVSTDNSNIDPTVTRFNLVIQ